ncbi:MAG TPA: ferrochelatase [Stellaceae bacterium]|nr:ferrochelatase [Stellaceae bacterium]
MSRVAVVLFNLGGPDSLEAVEPFLYNLFSDKAIVALPNPVRALVARLIARRRGKVARHIYARMGNASPIVANTETQAKALEQALGPGFRCFIAMRYWPPLSEAVAAAVKAWRPEEVALLPLYPQFSSTTTASSLSAWRRATAKVGLAAPTRAVCCYPAEPGFIAALAARLAAALAEWPAGTPVRVLLSAHGLPQRIVARGDPYQAQIEATAAALRERLGREVETVVCYQSRVGPLRWLEPATDAEIRRAGATGVGLIVLPIAFVSEHSETLVELDLDYGTVAREAGVPRYVRAPTVGCDPAFIAGLASLVRGALARGVALAPPGGQRLCPFGSALCPFPAGGVAR